MARKLLKRYMPSKEQLAHNKALRAMGQWIHNENLWHLNRYSASMAGFVGVFMCFMPIPTQMPCAALAAVMLRCNLPLSVALVWITNPLTMPVIFYGAYKLGAFLLGQHSDLVQMELSLTGMVAVLEEIWQPLLLGCIVCGIFFGSLTYGAIRLLWRLHVQRQWHQRSQRRRARKL